MMSQEFSLVWILSFWVLVLSGIVTAFSDDYAENAIIRSDRVKSSSVTSVQKDIEHYLRKGFLIAERIRNERKRDQMKQSKRKGGETYSYFASMKRSGVDTEVVSACEGLALLETARVIVKSQNWSMAELPVSLELLEVPHELYHELSSSCKVSTGGTHYHPTVSSDPSGDCLFRAYRSADGSCNNPDYMDWGSALQPYTRLLLPAYGDGIGSPRGGGTLPNPRSISLRINNRPNPAVSRKVTQMIKLWGQFVDHDVVRTPEVSAGLDTEFAVVDMPCCDGGFDGGTKSSDCIPITIPLEDYYFNQRKVACLRFVRSAPFAKGITLGLREQVSEVTAFIDGSNVYGSNEQETNAVRAPSGGRLRVSVEKEPTCSRKCPLSYLPETGDPINYFLAGDTRVNEQPSLTSMHTIWMRFHNLIADRIQAYTGANSDTVFQEARKIVVAVMQHITYTEFLPVVLGDSVMERFDLVTPNRKFLDGSHYNLRYDRSVNPTIYNVFGAAAYRFGHTLISGDMSGTIKFLLSENFFNGQLQKGTGTHPSEIIEAEAFTSAEGVDSVLHESLRNKLFPSAPNFDNGNDLYALNIMRGRDHGIPSYNSWRRLCGLRPFANFEEMYYELDIVAVNTFKVLYRHVDDVDLFPAALAEEKPRFTQNNEKNAGILGPTFSCLLARQFRNLKYGDRFWYENGPDIQVYNTRSYFEPGQLHTIRHTSLAYVLCETADMRQMPKYPMKTSGWESDFGSNNPIVDCSRSDWEYPDMLLANLEAGDWWRPFQKASE